MPGRGRGAGGAPRKGGTVGRTSAGRLTQAGSAANVSFDEHFGGIYGERWPALKAAMARPATKVAMWNRFCEMPFEEGTASLGLEPVECAQRLKLLRPKPLAEEAKAEKATADEEEDSDGLLPPPPRDEKQTPAYYCLDLASALVVEHLDVEQYHRVLDICASPGGKSIAISQMLSTVGELTSNEVDGGRCARLKRNVHEFVPPDITQMQNVIVKRDGTRWHNPNFFDRVLLDAPCSSERHLVMQGATSTWRYKMTADCSARQVDLLLRTLETLKVGGRAVYSTCSISPQENDEVVATAMRKTRCGVKTVVTELPLGGEATIHGWMVMPDKCDGWGPMYCAAFHKVSEYRGDSDSEDSDEDSD